MTFINWIGCLKRYHFSKFIFHGVAIKLFLIHIFQKFRKNSEIFLESLKKGKENIMKVFFFFIIYLQNILDTLQLQFQVNFLFLTKILPFSALFLKLQVNYIIFKQNELDARIKGRLFQMRCLSLSGLCLARKIGIFILGTLTIMTVDQM